MMGYTVTPWIHLSTQELVARVFNVAPLLNGKASSTAKELGKQRIEQIAQEVEHRMSKVY